MTKQEADRLIETIRTFVLEGPGHPGQKVVATSPNGAQLVKPNGDPKCSHVFRDSKCCIKCGWVPPTEKEVADTIRATMPHADENPFVDQEKLYQRFKKRLIDECSIDPILLQLLTTRPEIVIEVEPRRITIDGKSLKGRLALLMSRGWFDAEKKNGTTRAELERTGPQVNSGNLSVAITDFVKDGFLTREGDGFRLASVKITEQEVKTA